MSKVVHLKCDICGTEGGPARIYYEIIRQHLVGELPQCAECEGGCSTCERVTAHVCKDCQKAFHKALVLSGVSIEFVAKPNPARLGPDEFLGVYNL